MSLADVKRNVLGEDAVNVDGDADNHPPQKSAATLLVEHARKHFDLGVSDADEAFARPKNRKPVVHLLRGGKVSLRAHLARSFFAEFQKAANQQALSDALATLDGFAQAEAPTRLFQRVGSRDGITWLDLGDDTGRAVRIASRSWSVVPEPDVLFKRTKLTSALPEPVRGGDVEELWTFVNVTPEDRPPILAYLVAALIPDIPHPVLGLFGQQGSAKSTTMRVLVMLLDPSPVPYRRPPKDADAWVTAAAGSWFVALDNLSSIPQWLSDVLCRAVTGEGDVRRKLYTDGDLHVHALRRVVALTGIDLGSLTGDLAERLLPVNLDIIDDEDRRDESSHWPAWEAAHPRILGALLDLAADVLARLPEVQLARMPRMADFARILAAVDEVRGTDGLARYLGAQGRLAHDTLSGDTFITYVMEAVITEFNGTAAELLELATPNDDKWRKPKGWPTNARVVTQRLRRQAPVLRKAGWHVSDDAGKNKENATKWKLVPPPYCGADSASPSLPSSPAREGQDESGEGQGEVDNGHPRPTRPSSPLPRHGSPAQDGATSKARKASLVLRSPLADRALAVVSRLKNADLDSLRNRYAEAASQVQPPSDWPALAKDEPVEITAALELLAADSITDTPEADRAYLEAARNAARNAS